MKLLHRLFGMEAEASIPYFIEQPLRALTDGERSVVVRLLQGSDSSYFQQVATLQIVGRCGCGQCPTIFFKMPQPGVREADLSTYAGRDQVDGLVAAVLLQSTARCRNLSSTQSTVTPHGSLPRPKLLSPMYSFRRLSARRWSNPAVKRTCLRQAAYLER